MYHDIITDMIKLIKLSVLSLIIIVTGIYITYSLIAEEAEVPLEIITQVENNKEIDLDIETLALEDVANVVEKQIELPNRQELKKEETTLKTIKPLTGSRGTKFGSMSVSNDKLSCSSLVFKPGGEVTILETDLLIPNTTASVELIPFRMLPITLSPVTVNSAGIINTKITLPKDLPLEAAMLKIKGVNSQDEKIIFQEIILLTRDHLTDSDGDTIPDACDLCPQDVDSTNADIDYDEIGDVCDFCPIDGSNDVDGDGICSGVDLCPLDEENDKDGDSHCEIRDNCPNVKNDDQKDSDFDGVGDACEA